MDDETIARGYAGLRGWRYLSHEVYGDMIWIAVEHEGDRFEVKIGRDRR